jgi:hypothetical protein
MIILGNWLPSPILLLVAGSSRVPTLLLTTACWNLGLSVDIFQPFSWEVSSNFLRFSILIFRWWVTTLALDFCCLEFCRFQGSRLASYKGSLLFDGNTSNFRSVVFEKLPTMGNVKNNNSVYDKTPSSKAFRLSMIVLPYHSTLNNHYSWSRAVI